MSNFKIFKTEINKEENIIIKYYLKSKTNLKEAAWNLAIGQSVGNPNVRNKWETTELFELYSAKILHEEKELVSLKEGIVYIAFPNSLIDFDTDGISHLLCVVLGGQVDIDIVEKCHVLDAEFPKAVLSKFKGPKYGISGIRNYMDVYNKPVLGSIVKPKTGVSPDTLLEMVKEMVDGGVNFIKEDEILSNPHFCRLEDRVEKLSKFLQGKNVVYTYCINSDPFHVLNRVKFVHENGGNGVHINVWSGLGVYKSIRDLDLPIFIHFQKSGDKVFTDVNNSYRFSWDFISRLAGMMGVDFIHSGMIGGYYDGDEEGVLSSIKILREHNVLPALSCGFHPGLTEHITSIVGVDYMANVGGAVHGHPGGTIAGAKAMRQSIDGNHESEYHEAIKKWGLHKN